MRRSFVDHGRKLLICWTPKCACTSLSHWFFYGVLERSIEDVQNSQSRGPREWLRHNGYILGLDETMSCMERGYQTIAFTREPFARAISAYADKFVGSGARKFLQFDDLEGMSRQLYLRAKQQDSNKARKDYTGLSFTEYLQYVHHMVAERGSRLAFLRRRCYAGLTFGDYVRFLTAGEPYCSRADPVLNVHWNTQVPFLWTEQHVRQTEFWDVRQLDVAIAMLNDRYGVNYTPAKLNSSAFGGQTDAAAADIPSRLLAERDALPSRDSFETEPARSLIREAYSIDFETLGYA